jgi:hypothetical protein
MKKIISFGSLLAVVSPFVAFAASSDILSVIATIKLILSYVIPLLITLAVVYFIWGVIQYTVSTDDEAKKGARMKIIQGLIGLFIIIAFWGIVFTVSNQFGVGPTDLKTTDIPCVPTRTLPC